MIRSMTGYGRAKQSRGGRNITVEVRSVNNRYLDCTVKMPRAYIFAEDAIKTMVQKQVSRGKVDVFITVESAGAEETVVNVNEPLAKRYIEALEQLKTLAGESVEHTYCVTDLARLPDVLTVTKAEEDLESISEDLCAVLQEALEHYTVMRQTEGKRLAEDIAGRAKTISELLSRVEERAPGIVADYRARLTAKLQEVLGNTQLDEGRIITEAAIYADKVAVDAQSFGAVTFHAGAGRCSRQKAGLSHSRV